MVDGEQREMIIIAGRHKHKMRVVRACGQRLFRFFKMGKFGIADLQNTRQSKALLIDVLSIGCRSWFARDHFHAVGSFHRVKRRNVFEIKKPAAPGAVVGIRAMEDRKVRRIGAILDEIEPFIIILAGCF